MPLAVATGTCGYRGYGGRSATSVAIEFELAPHLGLRPAPALIAFAGLLVVSSAELDRLIERELAANAALERIDPPRCAGCGAVLAEPRCRCRERRQRLPSTGEASRGLDAVPGEPSALEAILADAQVCLSPDAREAAEAVVAGLDERGLLPGGAGAVAWEHALPRESVERAIAALRDCGPPGLCASDIRECLALQLEARPDLAAAHPILPQLIAGHLDALAHGAHGAIATALGCTRADVIAGRDAIRAHMRPFVTLDDTRSATAARRIEPGGQAPEIAVHSDGGGVLRVEVLERRSLGVFLSPAYGEIADRANAVPALAPAELEHVAADVRRARRFLAQLEGRWTTLERVAREVVGRQRAFIVDGEGTLLRLTRSEVAAAIGVHESTVSRTVAGKHVRLPSGRVVPLARFFETSQGPAEILRRVIASEPRPLSDRELAEALAKRGHRVARRTVAKYRAGLGLLPAHLR